MKNYRGLQTPRDLRSGAWSGRENTGWTRLTERSVFIVSFMYIQIYKGISLRSRRGKKESALSEAGETFHEVARQGR